MCRVVSCQGMSRCSKLVATLPRLRFSGILVPMRVICPCWGVKAMRLLALLQAIATWTAVAFAGTLQGEAQDKPPIEIVPQLGHPRRVDAVAYSPNGKMALSGSLD